METKILTGYPSIDKPWMRYYSEEAINKPLPDMTAYEYLKKLNCERLDLQAIDSPMGNYTYGELFKMIDATASSFWEMNVGKGKIVVEMLPVMPHESFLFYGVDAVGAALAPLPPMYPVVEVCDAINKFDAELFFTVDYILTDEMERAIYENTKVRNIVNIGFAQAENRDERTITWEEFLEKGKDTDVPDICRDPQDLLFVASTGGSTGTPKSVMLNDNSFNIAVHQFINSDLDYCAGDRWQRLWPLFSATAAVANNHLPLCTGMNNLLRQFPLNIADFDKMVLADRPQHLVLIPQLLDVLEKSELLQNEDLSYIKTVGCGGLGLTAQFEERVNSFMKKHNISGYLGFGWGCTESAAVAAHRHNFETTVVGTVGAPLVNTIVSVFESDSCKELTYDEEGELCICSPTIMMGYYNNPEMTNNVVKKHADGRLWLHTGDLGTVNKDGIVTVKGRMTRMIFVFPTAKIYPQAIEDEIAKVEGVMEVAICEIPDKEHEGFYLPICFIVPDGKCSDEETRKNVEAYCKENLPEYSVPRKIYVRESLPLTRVGKVDYLALEKEAENTK